MLGTTIPVTAFASDENNSEFVTMSVEEFAELAEDQGFIVMYEKDYVSKTRMANYFTLELTNNNFNEVSTDINLLDETARVQVVLFSDNITSVDVKLWERHANETVISYNLTEGQWSDTIDVQFLHGYVVKIKANSDTPLSESNPGHVTVYWTDREEDWS